MYTYSWLIGIVAWISIGIIGYIWFSLKGNRHISKFEHHISPLWACIAAEIVILLMCMGTGPAIAIMCIWARISNYDGWHNPYATITPKPSQL